MKQVSTCLGVARSHLAELTKRPIDWQDRRRQRQPDDAELVGELHELIADLPSYGYRRVWGLLRRQREEQSRQPVNAKRVYRVTKQHGLLLAHRIRQPGMSRQHNGRVAVVTSNTRWCSDGFEFRCGDGY